MALRNRKYYLAAGLALIIGVLIGNFWKTPYKMAIAYWYQEEYSKHVFRCDDAMRQHYISKAQLSSNPHDDTIKNLQAAEIGLIACHRYDKLQKKLIRLGLSQNELALMGLEAIEMNKSQLQLLIQQHEIRY